MIMEQAFITPQQKRVRLDGKEGHIQIHVENSLRQEVPFRIYVAVNDHYELRRADGEPLDGRNAQELVSERWDTSIRYAETWFDKIMGLTNGS